MVSPGEWAARKATTLLTLSFSTTPDRAQPLPPCPLLLLSQRSTTSNNRVRTLMKVIDKNFHGARESTTMFVPTDASRPSSSPFARCLSGMQLLKARRTATLFPLPMKNAPSPVASLKSHPFVSSPLASGDFFASASPRTWKGRRPLSPEIEILSGTKCSNDTEISNLTCPEMKRINHLASSRLRL